VTLGLNCCLEANALSSRIQTQKISLKNRAAAEFTTARGYTRGSLFHKSFHRSLGLMPPQAPIPVRFIESCAKIVNCAFHGHRETDTVIPLFLAARLIEQGKRVLCLDGGKTASSSLVMRDSPDIAKQGQTTPSQRPHPSTAGQPRRSSAEKWPLPMGVSLPFACARKIPHAGCAVCMVSRRFTT